MELRTILTDFDVDDTLPDIEITGLTHDSRQVKPGDMFVALPGLHVQGTDFITQAVDNGAVAILGPDIELDHENLVYITSDDPAASYSRLAANYYGHPSDDLNVIGITGTNGKTTTADLLSAILRTNQEKTATIGTLGLQTGTEKTATGFTTPEANRLHEVFHELKRAGFKNVVMEVSSHALVQHRVDDVSFNAAVFTNLSQEHLDYHDDMKSYIAAKTLLFESLPEGCPAIVNLDDDAVEAFMAAAPGPIFTFGHSPEAHLHPVDMGLSLERTIANLSWMGDPFAIESTLIGRYNLENIMAAAATALALDIDPEIITQGIISIGAIPGRLEKIESAAPGQVFIDYAHTEDAYAKVLGTMRELAGDDKEIITLFGCGGDRDRTKRPLMAATAENLSDQLIITSDNPRTESLNQIIGDIEKGLTGNKHTIIKDRKDALLHALGQMKPNTILMIFGKGREEYEIIGEDKVYHSDVAIVKGLGK